MANLKLFFELTDNSFFIIYFLFEYLLLWKYFFLPMVTYFLIHFVHSKIPLCLLSLPISEPKSFCFSSLPSGLWRRTKRKERSFKDQRLDHHPQSNCFFHMPNVLWASAHTHTHSHTYFCFTFFLQTLFSLPVQLSSHPPEGVTGSTVGWGQPKVGDEAEGEESTGCHHRRGSSPFSVAASRLVFIAQLFFFSLTAEKLQGQLRKFKKKVKTHFIIILIIILLLML